MTQAASITARNAKQLLARHEDVVVSCGVLLLESLRRSDQGTKPVFAHALAQGVVGGGRHLGLIHAYPGGSQTGPNGAVGDGGHPAEAVDQPADLARNPEQPTRGDGAADLEEQGYGGPARGQARAVSTGPTTVDLEVTPGLGAHTDDVLSVKLGLDPDVLADLHDRSIIQGG